MCPYMIFSQDCPVLAGYRLLPLQASVVWTMSHLTSILDPEIVMSWVLKEVKFTISIYSLSVVFILLKFFKKMNSDLLLTPVKTIHDDTLGFHGCVLSTLPWPPLCRSPLKGGNEWFWEKVSEVVAVTLTLRVITASSQAVALGPSSERVQGSSKVSAEGWILPFFKLPVCAKC